MKLIFGSAAVKHWFPDFRIPNDLDFISSENYWIPLENSYWIEAFEYLEENNSHSQYVDVDLLYTIKVSHAEYDIHWDKTMRDIVWLQNKGCTLDLEFYNELKKSWDIIHIEKKINLNVKNEDFFRPNISRTYSHDYLHEILAFYDRPLHEKIRKDLNSPMCSEDFFRNLSKEDQIKCMMEETMVFMIERFLIPKKTKSIKHALYLALKTLITSSTKGWFNLELILNFETLIYYDLEHFKSKYTTFN